MIARSRKLKPVVLCATVLGAVILTAVFTWHYEGFGRRLEWITYDWRVKEAAKRQSPTASNLGLVFVNDSSIWYLQSGQAGYGDNRFRADLYWPRQVYGELVRELNRQGVDVVGFDILLGDLRSREEAVHLPGDVTQISDEYFAEQLAAAGRVVIAAENQVIPPDLFRTNAWALGDIGARRDDDGKLRRTKAFEDYVLWEPILRQAREQFDIRFDTNRIIFPVSGQPPAVLPIAPDGTFEKARLIELGGGSLELPPGASRSGRAFRRTRVWDLGITMAAHYLGIDLAAAEIHPGSHIALRGTNSVRRQIPIDDQNRFYIDWSLHARDGRVLRESFHSLLDRHYQRAAGKTEPGDYAWRGRVALVGSLASGNDLTDIGATPLDKEAYLTTRYLNVANSMLVNRFIHQPSHLLEVALIIALGLFSGIFTWNFRAQRAALCVLLLAVAYTALALYLFIANRYWLPMIIPLGGLFAVHMTLVTYRVMVEQKERRRIRSIFAKIVSPSVVTELLEADRLEFGGASREITVFFTDVRGFTELTDQSHAKAEDYVKTHRLSPPVAEDYFNQQAQEILRTVNLYLGTIAAVVKRCEGTLDKYIGDCVMAFWGAPAPNPHHARSCVRAAIEAQRAIDKLNRERSAENARREQENARRQNQSIPPLPYLKILTMGAGVNTGVFTFGLMGSEQHGYNYTVFGRGVNLAARLEGLSGSGRILIGEATYHLLRRDDPTLADTCRELAPATVKGFRTPVRVYEVPWTHTPSPLPDAATPIEDSQIANATPRRAIQPAPEESNPSASP